MRNLLTKIFGDPNEAPLKPFQKVVPQVNALEPEMEALSDLELRELANGFRDRLEDGETLDDILPDSFAATREAARRALGQRHFDVQLLGGAVLTETTFEWKGLGFQLVQYLLARDFVAVQGIVALLAVIVAVTNFVVDIAAAIIDPRVRY